MTDRLFADIHGLAPHHFRSQELNIVGGFLEAGIKLVRVRFSCMGFILRRGAPFGRMRAFLDNSFRAKPIFDRTTVASVIGFRYMSFAGIDVEVDDDNRLFREIIFRKALLSEL